MRDFRANKELYSYKPTPLKTSQNYIFIAFVGKKDVETGSD